MAPLLVTDKLEAEHRLLRAMFEALSQWLVAGVPGPALRERAVLLALALDDHARIEEQEVFPLLRDYSEHARRLADMMEVVHDEARELFADIAQSDNPQDALWTIVQLTLEHFDREDNEVFPLAAELLEGK